MSANALPPPGPEVWQAQYLRLIAFTTEPAFELSRDWWRTLTGADPQTTTQRRVKQERDDSGAYDGVDLTMNVDVFRVQWTAGVSVAREVADPSAGIPNIGQFLAKREWFRDLMARWLHRLNVQVKRLAFAGTLVQPVADGPAGHELLDRYLRCVEVDRESIDILYRANRPRPSPLMGANLMINRLATWGEIIFTVHQQILVGGRADTPQNVGEPLRAVMLDLDINTAAEYQGPLPRQQLGQMFGELTDMALDIATRGDAR